MSIPIKDFSEISPPPTGELSPEANFNPPHARTRGLNLLALLMSLALMAPASAFAEMTFNVVFSGAEFGNNAEMSGTITFDPQPANGGFGTPLSGCNITAINLTVTGSAGGNADGTYTEADFNACWFSDAASVDFSTQLIGQPGFGEFSVNGPNFTDVAPFQIRMVATDEIVKLIDMPRGLPPEFSFFGSTSDVRSGQQVVLHDVDGDGDQDAVVVNTNGEPNRVYLNTLIPSGVDGFDLVNVADLGSEDSQGVAIGDINNDTFPDIFVANVGQNHVWFNDGAGNFTKGGQNIGLANSRAVALGDLNGDDRLDAFVVNSDSDAIYLYNTSTNLFASNNQVNLDTAQGTDVVLHDFDGDGDLDAVVSNNNEASALFENDGTGAFTQLLTFADSDRARGVTLVDLNGDNLQDLYFSRDNDQLDTIALNTTTDRGLPTAVVGFTTQAPSGVSAHNSSSVAFADTDGDQTVDLMVVSVDDTDLASSGNVVYDVVVGATPTFTERASRLGQLRSTSVALADTDGDSDVDAVFSNFGATHSIWHLKLAPTAVDDSITMQEDGTETRTSVTGVLANDTDPEGFTLGNVSLASTVSNGSLTLSPDGSFTYAPNEHFNGSDSFTYTMTDGTQVSNTATVTITVNAVNDAPVADDDNTPSTSEEVAVNIAPSISDIDNTAAELTVTITQQPTSAGGTPGDAGTASVGANNVITYTPATDFFGSATIQYQVTDGESTDSATITVSVSNVDDAPRSVEYTATLDEDGSVNVDLFSARTAPDDELPNGIVYDVDGDALTITIGAGNGPSDGQATVSGGVITYTPNGNFNGTDTLIYTIDDGVGATVDQLLNFTVTPVNDGPPNAFGETGAEGYATDEDVQLSVSAQNGVLANDNPGVDLDETESLTAVLVLPPAVGTLTLNSDGSFTYTPAQDNFGATFFRYKVSDGEQESSTVTASIIVNSVNDAPVAVDDALTLDEDASATSVNVTSNDTDVELQALTAYLYENGSKGSAVNTNDGSFNYTPGLNQNGADSFTYYVTDEVRFFESLGNTIVDAQTQVETITLTQASSLLIETDCDPDSDTVITLYDSDLNEIGVNDDIIFNVIRCSRLIQRDLPAGDYLIEVSNYDSLGTSNYDLFVTLGDIGTVNVTINPVNDPPVATADSDTTSEDTSVTFNVTGNDTDVDGDAITLSSCTDGTRGTTAINASTGEVTYTPSAHTNDVASGIADSFTCTVTDGALTDSATVTVAVSATNDAPVAVADTITMLEDQVGGGSVDVIANDTDVDIGNEGDTLTLVSCTDGGEGTTSENTTTGVVTYTPTNAHFNGSDTFSCTIKDSANVESSANVTVTVTPVNDDPELNGTPVTLTTDEDTSGTVDVLVAVSDVDGDTLSVVDGSCVITGASIGSVSNNGDVITYTPSADLNGTDSFNCQVTDGVAGSTPATVSVAVTVNAVNDDPVAIGPQGVVSIQEDGSLTISDLRVDVLDVDNDVLSVVDNSCVMTSTNPFGSVGNTGNTVTYTPNADQNGTDSFTCQVTDSVAGSTPATVTYTVSVIPVNDDPVANPTSVAITVLEDGSQTVDPTSVVTDVDGDSLTVLACSTPGNGGTNINGNVVTYSPNPNYNSSDSFSCTVSDGNGGGVNVTVNVTITPQNDDPTGSAGTLTSVEDSSGNVTISMSDIDGDTPSLSSCGDGTNGTTTISGATVTYTPSEDYYGADSFTCTVVDGQGGSGSVTVNASITPVNDLPTANEDSYIVDEDNTLIATVGGAIPSVLDNDDDDDNLQAPFYAGLTVRLIDEPVAGELTLDPDGSFSYTPEEHSVDAVAFTYEIIDNDPANTPSGVLGFAFIEITPINDVPVAVDDGSVDVPLELDEDTSLVVNVLDNDTDVANENQTLTVDSIETSPEHGSVEITDGGTTVTYTPNADYFGSDSFTYTITDGTDSSSAATVYLQVNNTPDAPVAADDGLNPGVDDIVMDEDTELVLSVMTNDVDVDGDALSIIQINGADVDPNVATDIGDATVVIENNSGFYSLSVTPDANFYGVLTFSYTISDGDEGTANSTANVQVTVNNTNDAPSTIDLAFNDGEEDEEYNAAAGALLTNITELDPNDTHTAELVTNSADGNAVVNPDGSFSFTPTQDKNGDVTFTYLVRDQGGLASAPQTVTLTLAPRNDAPVAVADGPFTNPEDSGEFVFNAASNDTDLDGDTLFVQSVGVPNPSTAGTVQVIEESGIRVIEFSPALHFNGTVEIPYTVIDRADFADPEALTASSTLTLEYTPVNDAPVAVADSFTDAFEDIAYTGNVLENDTDVDEGDSLTASLIAGSAVNGAVTLNSDGSFTFTPVADFNGDASFSYTTQDAAGEPSLSAVSVTITFAPVDDNPVATADSYTGATEDTDFVVADVDGVLGNDSDVDVGDTRTAHVTGVAVGGSVNLSPAGGFTFTPDADFFGVASFQYVARDTTDGGDDVALDSAPVTVTIDFANTADAPVAVNDPSAESYTVDEDSSLTISAVAGLLANDFDVDNQPLSAEGLIAAVVTEPLHGTLNVEDDGSFTYTPSANYNGPDSFSYRADDGTFVSNIATVSLLVNPRNDAPVAVAQSFTTAEDSTLEIGAVGGLLTGASDIDDAVANLRAVLVSPMPAAQGTVDYVNDDGSFSFTPASNFNGVTSFTFRVLDDDNEPSASQTVTINVTPVNDRPVAANDGFSTDEDRTLNASPGVKINDTDVDGDTLTLTLVTDVANGTLTLNTTSGSFTYVPNANFNGTDSFTYTVSDGELDSTPATVFITVDPVNDAPVAVTDSYSTPEDNALTITALNGVLSNDSDLDEDALTAQLVQNVTAAEGTLALQADGSFVFTPAQNFNGVATFSYQARDGSVSSEAVTVSVTVTAVNDTPVARNDAFVVAEDSVLTRSALAGLLANDTDVDGDSLTLVSNSEPANGELVVDPEGGFTYTPALNFNGDDSFTYTVSDEGGLESTATVSISVGGNNDAPVAQNDSNSTDEDTPVSGNVLANDSDVDEEPLTIDFLTLPTAAEGALEFNAEDGSYTFSPALNFNGEVRCTYQAYDVAGVSSNIATLVITVNPVNDAPVATDDEYNTFINEFGDTQPYVLEDTRFTLIAPGVLRNDSDVDSAELIVTVNASPSHGELTLGEDGSISYTPEENYNGVDTFTYTINDGELDSAPATVTLNITPVNDSPVSADDSFEVAEEGTLTIAVTDLLGNDSDVDEDTLSVVLVEESLPSAEQGTLTFDNIEGTYTFVGAVDFTGEVTFSYLANDGELSSDPATVMIMVTPVNDAPVALADSYETSEDTELVVDVATGVLANDVDIDGDALIATLMNDVNPQHGDLTLLEDGSFVFVPVADFVGETSFTYVAQDADLSSEEVTVVITVTPVNDPPVAEGDSYETAEDTELTVEAPGLLANDSDIDSDASALTVSVVEGPAEGSLDLNEDGSFTYTPAEDANGEVSFTYEVFDGSDYSASATVVINVTPVNDAPVLVSPEAGELSAQEQTELSFTVSATDVDGDDLTYSVEGAPETASFDSETGVFSWTPSWDEAGSYTVTVSVTDGEYSDSRELTITSSYLDVDEDGLADTWEQSVGLSSDSEDSDGDSIDDATEVGDDLEAPSNVDGDDLIDALDEDSDDDGVSDADEAGDADLSTAPVDSDEDGVADFRDVDSDDDSVEDGEDNCRVDANEDQADLDEDGAGDLCDEDIDGDGVSNELEAELGLDSLSTDSDGDSISDAEEFGEGEDALDSDEDGVIDALDEDSDDDGLTDADEAGDAELSTTAVDSDADGSADYRDADSDNDGVEDGEDNCRLVENEDQLDTDANGAGDACDGDVDGDGVDNADDNCLLIANEDQADLDDDGEGDLCDGDVDGDGVDNDVDNCVDLSNESQADLDEDGAGDDCDDDDDNDGSNDDTDNCPELSNEDQADLDGDGAGDACDADRDGDGIDNDVDNCRDAANEGQYDGDGDGIGDICDDETDQDGDGVEDRLDNCPDVANPGQEDTDVDQQGDACDDDLDGDSFPQEEDNCPDIANDDQEDSDGDGTGDACDESPEPSKKPDSGCDQTSGGQLPLFTLMLFALLSVVTRRRRVA